MLLELKITKIMKSGCRGLERRGIAMETEIFIAVGV